MTIMAWGLFFIGSIRLWMVDGIKIPAICLGIFLFVVIFVTPQLGLNPIAGNVVGMVLAIFMVIKAQAS